MCVDEGGDFQANPLNEKSFIKLSGDDVENGDNIELTNGIPNSSGPSGSFAGVPAYGDSDNLF